MKNLEAVQEGLRIVRDALSPLVERVLRAEYGDDWWKKGVLAALEADGKPTHDRPAQGNAGDLDLQLALKLVQVYYWPLFSDDMDWSGRQRTLLSAVTATRNQYEGHVTPNREAELTDGRTQDILSGMETFLKLFDKKAADRLGNVAERLAMTQPEPELPDEGETIILRRSTPLAARVDRSTPARETAPIREKPPAPAPRREPVLRNGATPGSLSYERPKAPESKKPPIRWGAAVRSDAPAPARESQTTYVEIKHEPEAPSPTLRYTPPARPQGAARRPLRRMEEEPPEETIPAPPSRPREPAPVETRRPSPRSAPPATGNRRPAAQQRYQYTTDVEEDDDRPDPQLMMPAPLPQRTPRARRAAPYAVDITRKRSKKGRETLHARVVEPEAPARPPRPKREARPAIPLGRKIGTAFLILLGVALGVLLIWLDRKYLGSWGV